MVFRYKYVYFFRISIDICVDSGNPDKDLYT